MKLITRVLILAAVLALPGLASAGTYVSITVAPPALPVYEQPLCPGDGYIWTPGYWAWDGIEYYWVPGTWVLAPAVDVFWTPGYWGWGGGYYRWHGGYWGPHVGFYGGVNYGYGYTGVGYAGGRWEGGSFHYNRAVNNINVTNVHNTYNTMVVNNGGSRVSFNGGEGGIRAQPTSAEMAAAGDHHMGVTNVQRQHEQAARSDRSMSFAQNHGNPAVGATQHPFAGSNGHAMMHAPANAGRVGAAPAGSSQGHMPSSNFAPHENRAAQTNGVVNQRAEPSHGNVRQMPQGMQHQQNFPQQREPQQRAPQMNRPMGEPMRGPQGGENHGGGGGPRPQPQQQEHRREH